MTVSAPDPLPLSLEQVLAAAQDLAALALLRSDAAGVSSGTAQAALEDAQAALEEVQTLADQVSSSSSTIASTLATINTIKGLIDTAKEAAEAAVVSSEGWAAAAQTSKLASIAASSTAAASQSQASDLLNSASALAIAQQQVQSGMAAALASALTISNLAQLAANVCAIMSDATVTGMCWMLKSDEVGTRVVRHEENTSWYNMALNSNVRGSRRERPNSLLVITRQTCVDFYDGDDPSLPMWFRYPRYGSASTNNGGWRATTGVNAQNVCALNGLVAVAINQGTGANTSGLLLIDFDGDEVWRIGYGGNGGRGKLVADASANDMPVRLSLAQTFANAVSYIEHIDMTVLALTPPDPSRGGLPRPTIAVKTNLAPATIRPDGLVFTSGTAAGAGGTVAFDRAGNLHTLTLSGGVSASWRVAPAYSYFSAGWLSGGLAIYSANAQGSYCGDVRKVTRAGTLMAGCSAQGLSLLMPDAGNPLASLWAHITNTYNTGFMPGATRLAIAESSANLLGLAESGELVSNGTFAADLTGWTITTAGTSTAVQSGGAMQLTGDGTNTVYACTPLATIVGARYAVAWDNTGGISAVVGIGSALNGNDIANVTPLTTTGRNKLEFTATAATMYLSFRRGSAGVATIDNVSCQRVVANRSVGDPGQLGTALIVKGVLARSVVAAGSDIALISGFSAANYIEGGYDSTLDYMGDFSLPFVIKTADIGFVMGRGYYTAGAYAGAGWRIEITAAGFVQFISTTNGYVASQTTTGARAVNDGLPHEVIVARRGTRLEIWVDGALDVVATVTVDNLTNASAVYRLGARLDGTGNGAAAAGHAVGQIRVADSAPLPELIQSMWYWHRPLLQAGVAALLAGSSNVQDARFDVEGHRLAVATTIGTSIFNGLARVDYKQSTGAVNKHPNAGYRVSSPAAGALPDGMTTGGFGGTITATVTASGADYCDIRISGVTSGTSGVLTLSDYIAAVAGDTWTMANDIALVGGALANISSIAWRLYGFSNNTGTQTGSLIGASFNGALTGVISRPAPVTYTLPAASVYVRPYIQFTWTNASPVDFMLRLKRGAVVKAAVEPATWTLGMSNSDSHKCVALNDNMLIIGTAGGVDAWMPDVPLRARLTRRRALPVYDPTWGLVSGVTIDATPLDLQQLAIAEGRSVRFRATVSAVSYGGQAAERASYTVEGIAYRPIGGSVTVTSVTTTQSETTSTMDAVAAANTTPQTLSIRVTGKAATRVAWSSVLEIYDIAAA